MAETERKDICQRLEQDQKFLSFGGIERMANDVKEARELLQQYIGKAQQEERTLAHWVGQYAAYCSNCKCDAPNFLSGSEWVEMKTHYCPSCGARMLNADGEEENENG